MPVYHNYKEISGLSFPLEKVVNLILNVKDYPLFLKNCKAITKLEDRPHQFTAEVVMEILNMPQKYVSTTTFETSDNFATIISKSGKSKLFDSLNSIWKIKKDQNHKLHIEHTLEISINSFTFLAARPALDFFAKDTFASFLKRAEETIEKEPSKDNIILV